MPRQRKHERVDPDAAAVETLLRELYQQLHPEAKIKSYRQNSAAIRVRIIDSDFRRLDRSARHNLVWNILESLPENIQSQITMLLLLTPEEVKTSIANLDFDHPLPSQL